MTHMMERRGDPPARTSALVWAAAGLQAAFHLASASRYGLFRDELYYLSCASRPAAGYVDQPALSILVLSGWRAIFGASPLSLLVPPLLAGAAAVVLTGRLAARLGGGAGAQGLAALAAALAPIWLGFSGYYSMNAFDILLWTIAFTLFAAVLERESGAGAGRLWLSLGVVLALGLANKISVLWLGAGIAAALVATPARRALATLGPPLAAGVAALGMVPYVIWNALHGWPTLEFMRRATAEKYRARSLGSFAGEFFLQAGPLAAPLVLAGLLWLLLARDARRHRALAVVFLTTLAILLLNRTSKAEYLAASLSPLFAAGGVAAERVLSRAGRVWPLAAYGVLVLAGGLAAAPLAIPLLPVPAYLAYAKALGMAPSTTERNELGPLPQHFADRFGWPEMAAEVARVAATLPPGEKKTARVWARNYGEASALELYGAPLGVPKVLCPHNSWWLWSLDEARRIAPLQGTLIVIGGRRETLTGVFSEVVEAGRTSHPLAMPYENRPVWVCRGPKEDLVGVLTRDRLFI